MIKDDNELKKIELQNENTKLKLDIEKEKTKQQELPYLFTLFKEIEELTLNFIIAD